MTENKKQNKWEKENNLGKERKFFEGKCLASIKVSCQNTAALESRVTMQQLKQKCAEKRKVKPVKISQTNLFLFHIDFFTER